eukprot:c18653_g1_i1 orf=475-891(-)
MALPRIFLSATSCWPFKKFKMHFFNAMFLQLDLRSHIDQLHRTVQAAERNRQVAMRALSEERQRSLELEVKITRQREAAAALEEEVRVLKESHDALLASLRKKYSSSAAARTAAALLYQNWDNDDNDVEGAPPLRIRS